MKTILLVVTSLFILQTIHAQAPESINYQAVIKDTNGDLVTNQNISIQININQSTANGTTVYNETHSVTTSDTGLVTLQIGNGTTSDDFSLISWGNNTYFLNLAVDLSNGTNYSDLGTQQLVSVPYAFYANTSDSSTEVKNNNTTISANSGNVKINFGFFDSYNFTNNKIALSANNPNFGNNLQLEFNDGPNSNRITNVFPDVTSIPSPTNEDYELNLNVRGNNTLSARGNGSIRINNSYTLPNADGTAGQALVTDGSGVVSWSSASKLADNDGNTQIQVEESTNEDLIRFDIEGTEYFSMEKGRIQTSNTGFSVFIGENAGLNDDLVENENVAIGYKALETNVSAGSNTTVGAFSMNSFANGSSNTAMGIGTLQNLVNGNNNVAIGAGALSTTVGNAATTRGSNNVAIGFRAGLNNSGNGNVIIGYNADISGNESNRLIIDNTNTTTPLIYGEFNSDLIRINGRLETTGNVTTTGTTTTTGVTNTGSLKIGNTATLSGIYKTFINRNVGNVGGNSSRIETFTINGVNPGDVVFVSPSENLQSQIVIAQCWVSASNTVSVRFRNTDGGGQDPDGGNGATYYFSVIQ
ncbi:MAG: hypothetical protein AAF611_16160 [Bacteroidota bacterium]